MEQSGKEEQPDLIAFRKNEEMAVEVETFADHPEQVLRNYEKNVKRGRKVVFVVPDESVGRRIRKILGERKNYEVEVID